MSIAESIAKAAVREEQDAKLGDQREKARLKLEPFPTKIAPFSKETLDQLRGWKPPSDGDAYILLEKKFIERGSVDTDKIKYTLFLMRVENRPDQLERLRYNVEAKGMRILHWDRFPQVGDSNALKAQRAKMHFDPTRGKTAYEVLEDAIINHTTKSPSGVADKLAEKDEIISDLKARLKAKLEKEGAGS